MNGKYVVVEVSDPMVMEVPMLLPKHAAHANAAKVGRVVSAGFFEVTREGVRAFGHSIGLKVAARPEKDAELIGFWFGAGVALPVEEGVA